jgi:hypothetical protein
MSYPRDLDEIPDSDLIAELATRIQKREEGICDYCNRSGDGSPCRFPLRHAMARAMLTFDGTLDREKGQADG